MSNDHKLFLEQYPFLTIIKYGKDAEYVCVVQNQDLDVTTVYDFGSLRTVEQRLEFLRLADAWYWESNRQIPINIFLRGEWNQFRFCAKTFITKEVEILAGNTLKLEDLSNKRTKRRTITLLK